MSAYRTWTSAPHLSGTFQERIVNRTHIQRPSARRIKEPLTLNRNQWRWVPITVAARSKAWTVFARSNARFESHSRHGCLHCVVLCAGIGLATGWSLLQGVLPSVYRIKKPKKRSRSNIGLQSHKIIIIITVGDRTAYSILSPNRTPFQNGTDRQSYLRKVPRERWIWHTHPVRVWGRDLFMSSPRPLFHGTRRLSWRPISRTPRFIRSVGLLKGSNRGVHTIEPLKFAVQEPAFRPAPYIYIYVCVCVILLYDGVERDILTASLNKPQEKKRTVCVCVCVWPPLTCNFCLQKRPTARIWHEMAVNMQHCASYAGHYCRRLKNFPNENKRLFTWTWRQQRNQAK
jgi:hypothetical protein